MYSRSVVHIYFFLFPITIGPAGTGKTESVKALGNQLGRFVLVFNCDERFDFQVGNFAFLAILLPCVVLHYALVKVQPFAEISLFFIECILL